MVCDPEFTGRGRGMVNKMNYLIVVAHPDDEVLGAGATIYKLTERGDKVEVCILSGNAGARAFRPSDLELHQDMEKAMQTLGVSRTYVGDFPNIEFNNVPHLKLVQFIEESIQRSKADIVMTHYPGDTNNDHLHTSMACQAAVRLFQRREDVKPLQEFLYMEVPSSTEWCVNTGLNGFRPNTFIEVGRDGIAKKLEALACYRGVMRDYPHPRSHKSLESLAVYRGSQSGCNYAEAYENVLRRITL